MINWADKNLISLIKRVYIEPLNRQFCALIWILGNNYSEILFSAGKKWKTEKVIGVNSEEIWNLKLKMALQIRDEIQRISSTTGCTNMALEFDGSTT